MAGRKDHIQAQHLHRMKKKQSAEDKKKERDNTRANNTAKAAADITRSLPFSNEAEKGFLSCFFHNPEELLPDAQRTVPEAAFYHPANRTLFQTAMLFYRWSMPFEYIALADYLTSKGLIDKVGGQGALAELLDFIPTPQHYGYYKSIILDNYLLRLGIGISTEHIQSAYEHQQGGLDEWTKKFAADALELRQQFVHGASGQDGADLQTTHDEMVDVLYEKGPSTGFPWMDKLLGGLLETALVLFQGRRAIGKSSIARQIAWHAAKYGKIQTEVFTVEMTRHQYYEGLCCLEGVDGNSYLQKTFQKHELDIMDKMRAIGKNIPLKLHDDVRTIGEVVARMETAHLKRKSRLFIVDMPQRLTGDKSEGRERELSGIFWALKDAAKRLRATVLAPVHLNSALIARGSEDIENHADQIFIMAGSKDKPTPLDTWSKKILLQVSKNRYGPEGACLFHFTGKHVRFEEAEENNELEIEPAEESKPKRGR